VALSAIVADASLMVQHLAHQRGIRIRHVEVSGFKVIAAPGRLKQVVLNLLSNAIKYNRDNGAVDIRAERVGGSVKLAVSDTGVGIAADRLPELFQPFSRLGYEAGEIEGTGIGLALSKRIVEAMSGTIGVETKANVGSTFWVLLPEAIETARSASEANPGDGAESSAALGRSSADEAAVAKCILYVEDNPANLMLMEDIVNRIPGVRLLSARSAELGIELARREIPDLIIMDIHLPGMNGIEALARLRAQPRTTGIPVIALTADAMAPDVKRGLDAGFDGYHTKPIQVAALIGVLEKALFGGAT
jgi:CheY-like chemotaxis protein